MYTDIIKKIQQNFIFNFANEKLYLNLPSRQQIQEQ